MINKSKGARILRMPRTAQGRRLLRECVVSRNGSWDFPAGMKLEDVDFDADAALYERAAGGRK